MKKIGKNLAELGYTLRSGGAIGSDTAFEEGSDEGNGVKEIFLPWKSFNDRISNFSMPTHSAKIIANDLFPWIKKTKPSIQLLISRNVHQILGYDCKSPSSFVICYTTGSGGTMYAIKLAEKYNIPVYNLFDINTYNIFYKIFN